MNKLKEYINRITPICNKDWDIISGKTESLEYEKKTIILKSGKVENYIYLVEKGILRYYIPHEDKDLTFGFCFENELGSAYDSFIQQLPSKYQVEALTSVKICRISYSSLQEIYNFSESGCEIGRIIGEQLFIKSIKRELSLLNDSAEKRYTNLFTERPVLLQKIPLKYIASFIGITPQALSRIRGQIT